MSKYTENYKLILPEQNETYDIDVANANNRIIDDRLSNKVDKVIGKGLSTNDFTDNYKSKLDKFSPDEEYLIEEIDPTVASHIKNISKEDIASWNNKYTKEETSQLLQNKVDKVEGKGLSENDFTTQLKEKLNSLENYNDEELRKLISDLNSVKVDKTDGKNLSTNDFTNEYKEKLDSLENYNDTEVRETINNLNINKVDKADGKDLSSNDFTNEYKANLENMNKMAYKKVSLYDIYYDYYSSSGIIDIDKINITSTIESIKENFSTYLNPDDIGTNLIEFLFFLIITEKETINEYLPDLKLLINSIEIPSDNYEDKEFVINFKKFGKLICIVRRDNEIYKIGNIEIVTKQYDISFNFTTSQNSISIFSNISKFNVDNYVEPYYKEKGTSDGAISEFEIKYCGIHGIKNPCHVSITINEETYSWDYWLCKLLALISSTDDETEELLIANEILNVYQEIGTIIDFPIFDFGILGKIYIIDNDNFGVVAQSILTKKSYNFVSGERNVLN